MSDFELSGICRYCREVFEKDSLLQDVGDKFNAVETAGTFCYQLCTHSLSTFIHLTERDSEQTWKKVAMQVAFFSLAILTAPIAAIGFVIKRAGACLPHDRSIHTDALCGRTAPEKIDEVYDIIQSFSRLAEEIGLDYRMVSGTALGAARHGGIIPWDDDGDFGILEPERRKIEQAVRDGVFARYGLEAPYDALTMNYPIRFTEAERRKRGLADNAAAIDLLVMKRVTNRENSTQEDRVVYAADFTSDHYPHDFFTAEEWEQPHDWDFGPREKIRLRGLKPEAAERYLRRAYGNDCFNAGLKTHRHTELSIFGLRFSSLQLPVMTLEKVRITDFSPASGTKWTT